MMSLRRLRSAMLPWLVVAGSAAPAWAQDDALGASLQGLLDHARAHSPDLAAMRQEALAAAQRIDPAGALPDPVLRVELMNFNNYGNSAPASLLPSQVGETRYTLLQTLPLGGKRGLRRDAAVADALQADARTDAAWVDLAARIKVAHAETWRTVGNERLAAEVLGLMGRIEQVAQARYAGGLAGQPDVIRAQLEQTAMRAELIALDSERRQLRARINGLLARDAGAALSDPALLRPLPAVGSADTLRLAERAREHNPLLAAEAARLAAARKNQELAHANRVPDLQLGLSPTQVGSRITTWSLMFELNIPFQQGTRRSQESEADAMAVAANARVDAVRQQLLGELGANLAALDAARHTAALIRSQLLPQSEFGLQAALASYENGKLEMAVLIEAQRQIRRARQELLKSEVEAQLRLAEIERIVGEDL